jgi:hypothetical protein
VNCYTHPQTAAVGLCAACQKAVCRECVGVDSPRVVCRDCVSRRVLFGFEYRSAASIGGWPLLHVCAGFDPVTMRPRVARGVIAVGNIAVGGVAIAGLAAGLITVGGLSIGLLFALGGAAIGVGLSIGGVAVGAIAIGGVSLGFSYAVGGVAVAPAFLDGQHCDPAVVEFVRRWFGSGLVPPNCR